jgi:hypothetical protein
MAVWEMGTRRVYEVGQARIAPRSSFIAILLDNILELMPQSPR